MSTGLECINYFDRIIEFHGKLLPNIIVGMHQFIFWKSILLQLEKSPTLGSIETTDHEKRCLAEQSLKFNLGDKIFNELFPDIAIVKNTKTVQ
jgi:hypothetical protein